MGKVIPGMFCSDILNVTGQFFTISCLCHVTFMLACVVMQIYKNQASSILIFEMAKTIVWLQLCLPASHGIKSVFVPPGCNRLLTSLFADDRIACAENPKSLAIFFQPL